MGRVQVCKLGANTSNSSLDSNCWRGWKLSEIGVVVVYEEHCNM